MTRTDRRREREAEHAAAEQAQYEREAKCIHWRCRVTCWDWEGRPKEVKCDDCGGTNDVSVYD